jgi:hypothetical protein
VFKHPPGEGLRRVGFEVYAVAREYQSDERRLKVYPYVNRLLIYAKVPGPHADVGGEVLDGMYAERCTSLRGARISGDIGQLASAGDQVSGSEAESGASGIVSKPNRTPSTGLLCFGKS